MGANSEALWNFSPEESQKELQQGYTVGFMGRAFAQLIHINEHLIYARHSIRFLGGHSSEQNGQKSLQLWSLLSSMYVCAHRAIKRKV